MRRMREVTRQMEDVLFHVLKLLSLLVLTACVVLLECWSFLKLWKVVFE